VAFALSGSTLYSYDVTNVEAPELLDSTGIPHAQSMDLEDTCLLIGTEGAFSDEIVLVDVGDPLNMVIVGRVNTGPVLDVALRRPFAYVMPYSCHAPTMLSVVDVHDAEHPFVVGGLYLPEDGPICAGPPGYLYAAGQESLRVVSVQDAHHPQIVSAVATKQTAFYPSVHCAGNNLAVVGLSWVQLFDVSSPERPILIGRYEGLSWAEGAWCGADRLLVLDEAYLRIFEYPPQGSVRPSLGVGNGRIRSFLLLRNERVTLRMVRAG
jgi:hypothetical protein